MTESNDNSDLELLKAHGQIMQQLLQSDRFVEFFKLNYDLHRIVDDDNKEVNFTIIEVPPEVVSKRISAKVGGVQLANPGEAHDLLSSAPRRRNDLVMGPGAKGWPKRRARRK